VPSVTQFDLKDIQLPGSLEAEVRRGRTLSNIGDQFERRVEQVSAEANIREVMPIFCIYDQGPCVIEGCPAGTTSSEYEREWFGRQIPSPLGST